VILDHAMKAEAKISETMVITLMTMFIAGPEMAWGLRTLASTPRTLRELMILRSAHAQDAAYQWADHTIMAMAAGVSQAQIDAIPEWQSIRTIRREGSRGPGPHRRDARGSRE
jgi:hypothetical protein